LKYQIKKKKKASLWAELRKTLKTFKHFSFDTLEVPNQHKVKMKLMANWKQQGLQCLLGVHNGVARTHQPTLFGFAKRTDESLQSFSSSLVQCGHSAHRVCLVLWMYQLI